MGCFNPRSREGSDLDSSPLPSAVAGFNPRSREGSDDGGRRGTRRAAPVSIHAPARGATAWPATSTIRSPSFNPRSREGSDQDGRKIIELIRKFQSTLPRGERPERGSHLADPAHVSIHAPARGATSSKSESLWPSPVSIHAPARGATPILFRAHHIAAVSIHAPARGATPPATSLPPPHPRFNPRSREGSDPTVGGQVGRLAEFQSTLPRGERPTCPTCLRVGRFGFNPRSREWSDSGDKFTVTMTDEFQSTLPRGERQPRRGGHRRIRLRFNPRSREGSDPPHRPPASARPRFNPRSREGSDSTTQANARAATAFQSTLPRGERPRSRN